MSDYNSSLPVRTEADGTDERLHVKIVDGTTPSQRTTVDTDGNVHAEMHGNDPAGTDRVLRTSELGALTPDGYYDVANNTKPGSTGLIAHARGATPADSDQIKRVSAITNGVVHALDVAIHDENGAPFSASNPMPVTSVDSEGVEVNDYDTQSAVAAASTVNHNYTVTALKTLKLSQIEASASGKAKMEVQIETGVATDVWTTKWVMFNSTANPNMSLSIKEHPAVAAGVRVRVALTNLDKQAQDLYSTISGHEI
jgi:hypothetical protein